MGMEKINGQRQDDVYGLLASHGAPAISKDEFEALNTGPIVAVIEAWTSHVRGRNQVASDRRSLQVLQKEGGPNLRSAEGPESSRIMNKLATSQLESAKRNWEQVQQQLAEREGSLLESASHIKRLQAELDDSRKVAMVLSTLERKENIRSTRFREIRDILNARQSTKPVPLSNIEPTYADTKSVLLSASQTADLLMDLHSLVVMPQKSEKPLEHTLECLRASLARLVPKEDERVDGLLTRFKDLASHPRDLRKTVPETVSEESTLIALLAELRGKTLAIHDLCTKTNGLALLCRHSIEERSIFQNQSIPTLRSSMDVETLSAKNYVSNLQDSVTNSLHRAGSKLEKEVRLILVLNPNLPWEEVLLTVRNLIQRARECEQFVQACQPILNLQESEDCVILLDDYRAVDSAYRDEATKLLSRKIKKVQIGAALADDVRTLASEREALVFF